MIYIIKWVIIYFFSIYFYSKMIIPFNSKFLKIIIIVISIRFTQSIISSSFIYSMTCTCIIPKINCPDILRRRNSFNFCIFESIIIKIIYFTANYSTFINTWIPLSPSRRLTFTTMIIIIPTSTRSVMTTQTSI